jgi:hypothetical protein
MSKTIADSGKSTKFVNWEFINNALVITGVVFTDKRLADMKFYAPDVIQKIFSIFTILLPTLSFIASEIATGDIGPENRSILNSFVFQNRFFYTTLLRECTFVFEFLE